MDKYCIKYYNEYYGIVAETVITAKSYEEAERQARARFGVVISVEPYKDVRFVWQKCEIKMARLTKKYDDGTYGIERCTCEHEQKLGLLEDILEKHNIDANQLDSILTEYAKHKKIENALGIDLVTLVSALLSPYIYGITSDEDHEKPYIFGFDTRDVQLNAEEKTLDVYWQCSDEIYTQYKLSDYGKTWALTREALE